MSSSYNATTVDFHGAAGNILTKLAEAYPECWAFCVDGLIGATPELLVRRHGDRVTSRVLAGTIRRGQGSQTHDHVYAFKPTFDTRESALMYAAAQGRYWLLNPSSLT